MTYAGDITITSTHTSTSSAKKYIQPYLHKVLAWKNQSNLTLNPDKTTSTLFTPDPGEYTNNMDLKINNTSLHMVTHPKVLGLTLDQKFTYNTHSHKLSTRTQASTNNKSNHRNTQQDRVNRRRHSWLPTWKS